jgi:uncharacterized protein
MRDSYRSGKGEIMDRQPDYENRNSNLGAQVYQNEDGLNFPRAEISQAGLATFISQVYLWMFAALLLTAGTSFALLNSPEMFEALYPYYWGLFIGELALVFWLAARAHTMSPMLATSVFLGYAGINGITLSYILAQYTQSSAAMVFMVTAGTFGVMAFYGLTTKNDLTRWGSLLFMGLIGVVISIFINLFIFQSSAMALGISCIAVFIFVGLVAWDNQMIKQTYVNGMESSGEGHKFAIVAALRLYLDFIAIFVHLLNILGDRD